MYTFDLFLRTGQWIVNWDLMADNKCGIIIRGHVFCGGTGLPVAAIALGYDSVCGHTWAYHANMREGKIARYLRYLKVPAAITEF